MEMKDKFVGYVDILGFKDLVAKSEKGEGLPPDQLLNLVHVLGGGEAAGYFARNGPKWSPASRIVRRDLDFVTLQVSDCAVFSCEVSPGAAINLVAHVWTIVANVLVRGFMCRGYITRGNIYHTPTQVIGSGYNRAVAGEGSVSFLKGDDSGGSPPFVEIDPDLVSYVQTEGDSTVRELFKRLTASDSTLSAIYPFQRFTSCIPITPGFKPSAAKETNDKTRQMLFRFKEGIVRFADPRNPKAAAKSAHYLAALDKQLIECDRVDHLIDRLSRPFPNQAC